MRNTIELPATTLDMRACAIDNELLQCTYNMSLEQARLFHYFLREVDQCKEPTDTIVIYMKDFQSMFPGTNASRVYEGVAECATAAFASAYIPCSATGEIYYKGCLVFDHLATHAGRGYIKMVIHPDLVEKVFNLNHYTCIYPREIMWLASPQVISLYTLLKHGMYLSKGTNGVRKSSRMVDKKVLTKLLKTTTKNLGRKLKTLIAQITSVTPMGRITYAVGCKRNAVSNQVVSVYSFTSYFSDTALKKELCSEKEVRALVLETK